MLARLILPADESKTSLIRLPAPIEVEPKDAQVCLQKLVKLMDSRSISASKLNEIRQLFPDIPGSQQIRELRLSLDAEILENLGLYFGPDFAGVDPRKNSFGRG